MEWLPDSFPGLIYIGIALGPFVQEDAAVLAAASISVNKMQPTAPVYAAILIGLILSDLWKYWIGWLALRNPRARAYAEKQHVEDLGDKVKRHLIVTMLAARFIPLTRIPAYVACGFFGVRYWKYAVMISLTAFLYVTLVFCVVHALGEIVGESLRWLIPVVGLTAMIGYLVYKIIMRGRADGSQSR